MIRARAAFWLVSTAATATPPLVLDLSDHQRTLDLQPRQQIEVSLARPTDATQRWILVEPPIRHIVRQLKSGEGPLPGLPKTQVWTFETVGGGSQRLRFELRRAGEVRYDAEREFTVLIEVKN